MGNQQSDKGGGSDEGESDDPEAILVERKRRKGRDTAPIKLFYTELVQGDQGDIRYCKVCKKIKEHKADYRVSEYVAKTGDTALVNHLKKHPRAWGQYQEILLGPGKVTLQKIQGLLDAHIEKIVPKVTFSSEQLRVAIIKLVAACDLVSQYY
ncbi:hypothetical protein JB92DRAFT_3102509 [Gautieria morchelliformis]|nr:hypothetical protein JB92DRAFT_3102509 [Gautieria morchelliformis]